MLPSLPHIQLALLLATSRSCTMIDLSFYIEQEQCYTKQIFLWWKRHEGVNF